MMASKPRNISSSPTNLSPSRIAIRNSAAGRSASGGSSNNGSKKGPPGSPVTTTATAAGRTPQTRRKELALQPQQNSPIGSPKTNNNVKKNSTTSRKNSLNGSCGRPTISSTNRRQRNARNSATSSSAVKETAAVKLREETKFDGLWDVKTIENGLVRIPTQCLEELITKESIEKFYEVEDKPVAR